MNSQGLLLDKGVVRTGIDLQVRCQCDGAQWAVQRHCNVIGFSHRSNLARFSDAAAVQRESG